MNYNQLIFVYGTLRKGFYNHRVLGNSEFVSEFKTEPSFTMVSLGAFPAVIPKGNTAIEGEIYRVVEEKDMQNINGLEGYRGEGKNNMYDIHKIQTPHGEALMYVFKDAKGYPVVESGNWKKN